MAKGPMKITRENFKELVRTTRPPASADRTHWPAEFNKRRTARPLTFFLYNGKLLYAHQPLDKFYQYLSDLIDETLDTEDDVLLECGYGTANSLREWLGEEASEIGLRIQKGEDDRFPYTVFDGPASKLQEEFQHRGLNISVKQPILSREEHILLSRYLGFFCPEAKQILGEFCKLSDFDQEWIAADAVRRILCDPDDDRMERTLKDEYEIGAGRPLAAAVARILLAGSWNTLPNFTRLVETNSGIQVQQIRGKAVAESRKRKHQSIPQLVCEIIWSGNPAICWFSRYLLIWVPCYDRYVVIETTDTWEMNGYFDLARGGCDPTKPLKQSVKDILTGHWSHERSRWTECDDELHPWQTVSAAGLLSRDEAVSCRTEAWGADWVSRLDAEWSEHGD